MAQDREIASLMGIDVNRVIMITFAIGGILAGIAGVLFATTFEQVRYDMGFRPGSRRSPPRCSAGIGSIGGAVLGGFLLGLLQAIGPALILSGFGIPSLFALKDAFTFLVLVLVLVYRPGGPRNRRAGEGLMNRAVKAAGGAVTIFLGLVGLIERFADLMLVGEQITFSRLILVVAPFMVGYVVSRPRVELGEQRAATTNEALRWGAAAGAVGGALVGVAAVAVEAFGVERVRRSSSRSRRT